MKSLSMKTRDVAANVKEMEKNGQKLPDMAERFKTASRSERRAIAKKVVKRR